MENETNFFDEWVDKHIEVFTDKGDYINAEVVRRFFHNNINARIIQSNKVEIEELRNENAKLQNMINDVRNIIINMCKERYDGR